MPVLGKSTTKRLTLEGIEDAWIEVRTTITVGDAESLTEGSGGSERIALIARLITDWNFTDDAGKPEPITIDSVRLLPATVINQVTEILNTENEPGLEEKKD